MIVFMLNYSLPRDLKMQFEDETKTLYINESIKVLELKLIRIAIKNLNLKVNNIIIES